MRKLLVTEVLVFGFENGSDRKLGVWIVVNKTLLLGEVQRKK